MLVSKNNIYYRYAIYTLLKKWLNSKKVAAKIFIKQNRKSDGKDGEGRVKLAATSFFF